MTTLRDKIRGSLVKGADGTLSSTPEEEITRLASKAGVAAPPTTPLGGAMIGAGPHSQKMLGTPAQTQNAVRIAQSPDQTLAGALRRQGERTQATAAEQGTIDRNKGLAGLEDTSVRVQSMIDAEVAKLTQTGVQQQALPQGTAGTPTHSTEPGTAVPVGPSAADLANLLSGTPSQDALLRVNQALGRSPTSQISAAELQALYETASSAIARTGAESFRDSLTVSDLVSSPDFGYDVATLSSLLGIPETELAGYTVGQLSDAVSAVSSPVATTDAQAVSGSLGVAERGAARQAAREASTVGLRSSEAELDSVRQSLDRADTVSFGGKQVPLESLLKDETVSQVIASYLGAPEGSPTRKQLEAAEPELVAWIDKNSKALADAASKLDTAVGTLATTQKSREALGKVGKYDLPDTLMEKLVPDWGKLSATVPDRTSVPFFQYIDSLPPDRAEKAAESLSLLPEDLQKEIAGLTPEELASLELDKGASSPAIQAIEENQRIAGELEDISDSDAESIVAFFTSGALSSLEDAQEYVTERHAAGTLGLQGYGTLDGLDEDRDGKLDDPADILARMRQSSSKLSLKDILAGKRDGFSPAGIEPVDRDSFPEGMGSVYDRLSPYASDGRLTAQELQDSGILSDYDDLDTFLEKASHDGVEPQTLDYLETRRDELRRYTSEEVIDKYKPISNIVRFVELNQDVDPSFLEGVSRDLRGKYQALVEEAKGYRPGRLDDTMVTGRIEELQAQMHLIDRVTLIAQERRAKQAAASEAAWAAERKQREEGNMGSSSSGTLSGSVSSQLKDKVTNPGEMRHDIVNKTVVQPTKDLGGFLSRTSKRWRGK